MSAATMLQNPTVRKRMLYVAVTVSVLAVALHLIPKPSIDVVAVNALEDAINGNAGRAASLIPEYELRKNGMRRDQAKKFLAAFILPKLKGAKVVEETHFAQGGDVSGVVRAELRISNSMSARVAFFAQRADDGPIVPLRNFLAIAWQVEYLRTFSPKSTANSWLAAQVWGLRRDQAVLERYGFRGFVSDDERAPLTSLDAALKNLEHYAAIPSPEGPQFNNSDEPTESS